jgi:predicted nuclease of restriction endonuclease-like (RecB) superfamily
MKIEPTADELDYQKFLVEVKTRVAGARIAAARAVSRELIGLYWNLGALIVERQESLGWGQSIVERLAADLHAAFPGISGFSPQNLWSMRQFFVTYREAPILQQLVGEIPWGQNVLILQRVKDPAARQYYCRHTVRAREELYAFSAAL